MPIFPVAFTVHWSSAVYPASEKVVDIMPPVVASNPKINETMPVAAMIPPIGMSKLCIPTSALFLSQALFLSKTLHSLHSPFTASPSMTTRLSRCFLLERTSLRPFCGTFSEHLLFGKGSAEIVGRIAHELEPEEALNVITRVLEALRTASGEDALSFIRSCWEALLVIPRRDLGDAEGADLSLLIVAQGESGIALSAVGLESLWLVNQDGPQQIAGPETVETSHRGLPERTPKALELTLVDQNFIARCLGDGRQLPQDLTPYLPPGEKP